MNPRCAGQNCPKANNCKTHKAGNGWVDQWNPDGCKHYKPVRIWRKK